MAIELIMVFIVIFVWLLSLSFFFLWKLKNIAELFGGEDKKRDIFKLIDAFEQELKTSGKKHNENAELIETLEKRSKKYVQKVGLVKYNPFEETGGNHSFCLAMLNGGDTGVLITGLHTRQRTRLYVKYIDNGETDIELSQEEQEAIKKAK